MNDVKKLPTKSSSNGLWWFLAGLVTGAVGTVIVSNSREAARLPAAPGGVLAVCCDECLADLGVPPRL